MATTRPAPPPKKTITTPRRRKEFPRIEGEAAIKLLAEIGGLYEFNRTFMHPLGLVLGVEDDNLIVIDRRDHPDCVFTDKEAEVGFAKLRSYMEGQGGQTLKARKAILGFLVQPKPESRAS